MNRALFGSTGPTVYRHGSIQFLVDHNAGDQDGPRSCVEPGLYDPFFEAIEWNSPVTFLDLGANAGGFVLGLIKNGYEIKKGVAVELNPVTWSRLVYNTYANVPNAYGALRILNGAVAADEGMLEIRLGGGGVGDSVRGSENGTLYQLPQITLESLVASFSGNEIDILKIDIEGSEYDLIHTDPSLLRSVRYILIEIHSVPGRKESEIRKWIESAGFSELAPSYKPEEDNVFLFQKNH